jgi:hypothetical protein
MILDRKRRVIKEIHAEIEAEEARFDETEQEIGKLSQEYKIHTAELEAKLARARIAVEAASHEHVQARREKRLLTTSIAILKSFILKSTEMLEMLTTMRSFLLLLTPEGEEPTEHFTHPRQLVQELDNLERDNLMIIDRIQRYQSLFDGVVTQIGTDMETTQAATDVVRRDLDEMFKVIPLADKGNSAEALDAEFDRLAPLIKTAYAKCFGKETDMRLLTQLEKIEIEIDRMNRELTKISPDFILEKQLIREKERRDEQRQERQEKAERDQKLKIAQAIERAKKPVKPKTGRPLVQRSMPIRVEKKDDARLARLLREQARQEKLLYGPVFDD